MGVVETTIVPKCVTGSDIFYGSYVLHVIGALF